jgi:hypothetical protein
MQRVELTLAWGITVHILSVFACLQRVSSVIEDSEVFTTSIFQTEVTLKIEI